ESAAAQVLGGALLFGCVGLAVKTLVHAKEIAGGPFQLSNRDRLAAVLIGIVGGFVVGLTSVGTGVFFGLTMLVVFPLRAHKVVERRSSMRQRCSTSRVPPTLAGGKRRLPHPRLAAARLDPGRAHRSAG